MPVTRSLIRRRQTQRPLPAHLKAGRGRYGQVWKARDTRLDRSSALKASKAEFTARFDRKARAIAAFNHPNICQIHDAGPNYIVMKFIVGVPLIEPFPSHWMLTASGSTAGKTIRPGGRRKWFGRFDAVSSHEGNCAIVDILGGHTK